MANTVADVCKLKCGLLDSRRFRQKQATSRVNSLRLSLCQDVENVHSAGINSLDLENVEGR